MSRYQRRTSVDSDRQRQVRTLRFHLRAAVDILEQLAAQPVADEEPPPEPPRMVPAAPVVIPSSKLAYSIKEAAQALGICRSTVYELMNSGEIKTFKIGQRRLISADFLREWLQTHQGGL